MTRRRALLAQQAEEEELYPIGTNIITWSGYLAARDETKEISRDTGELIAKESVYGNGASGIYIPVSNKYAYQKNDNRILTLACYDKNKTYLGWFWINNLNYDPVVFLDGTKFIRLTFWAGANLGIAITRIS